MIALPKRCRRDVCIERLLGKCNTLVTCQSGYTVCHAQVCGSGACDVLTSYVQQHLSVLQVDRHCPTLANQLATWPCTSPAGLLQHARR